jgi:hypothetical protein
MSRLRIPSDGIRNDRKVLTPGIDSNDAGMSANRVIGLTESSIKGYNDPILHGGILHHFFV